MDREALGGQTSTPECKFPLSRGMFVRKLSISSSRGCDVPTVLYSFSFNLNPNWSKELCDGPEILEYIEDTVDKFDLRKHMQFGIECKAATWNEEKAYWNITFRDLTTDVEYNRRATIFVSAVGGISYPRDTVFPGMDTYKGKIFHTARWDHSYDYKNKRVAVIGNGCSAAQVVPAIVRDVTSLTQFARSAQWYHDRPNRNFTSFEKWCFKWIPLWERLLRLRLFLANDDLVATYMAGPAATVLRLKAESQAKTYIMSKAPEKYHGTLIPEFPLGKSGRYSTHMRVAVVLTAVQDASVAYLTQITWKHSTTRTCSSTLAVFVSWTRPALLELMVRRQTLI